VRVEAAIRWLQQYNRPIVVIVSVAVGCYFLWSGITGVMRQVTGHVDHSGAGPYTA
jgi:hypothetical protein